MGLTPLIQNELSSGNEKFFQSLIERTFLVYKIKFMSKLDSIKGLTPLFQNELRSESEKPFQSKIENFFENFFNL
jgi:hypothetical protein